MVHLVIPEPFLAEICFQLCIEHFSLDHVLRKKTTMLKLQVLSHPPWGYIVRQPRYLRTQMPRPDGRHSQPQHLKNLLCIVKQRCDIKAQEAEGNRAGKKR